jgi:glycosyltransferase involved in cell wall biosynthesis
MYLSERRQILKALKDMKIEVGANFDYFRKKTKIKGIDKVWFLKYRKKGLLGTLIMFGKKFSILLKNHDVDVVVVEPYSLHPLLPIWFLWKKVFGYKRPKFVLDIRSLPVDSQNNWEGKLRVFRFDSSVMFALKYFDGITMITEKIKCYLQKRYKKYRKDICVWSSAVDPSFFDPDKVIDLRKNLGFKSRFVIMYHGILSPNRGLQNSIEAISMIKKSHPEVLLLILGKGPAREELIKLIREKKLEDYVLLKNSVPFEEVPRFIKSAQAGILPFPDLDWWNTSSPIKLFEYLSMGKPVIVTEIEAHKVVLENKKCAIFVKNNLPENLAEGILQLVNKRSELEQLGVIARTIILEKHTWQKQALKIKRYFKSILTEETL